MKGYMFLILTIVFFSCNSQNMDIDSVIAKYDKTDFNALKNSSIYFRSTGNVKNTSVYFVNSDREANHPPYVVEVDNNNDSIFKISNHLIVSKGEKDYLERDEIKKLVKEYLKYNFCVLQVDKFGNVYINPTKQDSPILLRKLAESTPEDIDRFKLYKGNWYVRK